MSRYFLILSFLLIFGIFYSCKDSKDKQVEKPLVSVSVLPQKYFVNQIAGDLFEVNVMVPPGANPVTYEPTPEQMRKISESIAYFRIGPLIFEKAWIQKFMSLNADLKVYSQSSQVELMENEKHSHSNKENEKSISHDPHIWTSPARVLSQIKVIRDALVDMDSIHKNTYDLNYNIFRKQVKDLDSLIRKELSGLNNRKFMIFHPALTYYAEDYNLEQVSIEFEGKEPAPGRVAELVDLGRSENIKVIFIQKQFNKETAQTIADEINAEIIEINPLAYDWIEQMRSVTHKLAASLKNEQKEG
jgi:zinc transport system substrate-binding protein